MPNPIFTSSVAAARRAMKRHQRIPTTRRVPMTVLLSGEALHALRQLARPERFVPATVAAGLVVVSLSSVTPGPVAPVPLLATLAVVTAGFGAYVGARLFGPTPLPARAPTSVWRGAVPGVGALIVIALLVAAVGWLLAALAAVIF